MTLTLEKKIEIVNAINTAVAKGWTVCVEQASEHPFSIKGAIVYDGEIIGLTSCGRSKLDPQRRIFTRKTVHIEVDTIYQPPSPVDNKSSNSGDCDLSNSKPRSAARRAKTEQYDNQSK